MSTNRGQFQKGNEFGKERRFQSGNQISSKYKEEYCEAMIEYFNHHTFPTVELFAETLEVTPATLMHWREKHRRFNDAFSRCLNIQKGKLLEGGVLGAFNPQIVKFMAINCHGMSEKAVSDTTVTFKVDLSDELDEECN